MFRETSLTRAATNGQVDVAIVGYNINTRSRSSAPESTKPAQREQLRLPKRAGLAYMYSSTCMLFRLLPHWSGQSRLLKLLNTNLCIYETLAYPIDTETESSALTITCDISIEKSASTAYCHDHTIVTTILSRICSTTTAGALN
jgi:hypothetical protein